MSTLFVSKKRKGCAYLDLQFPCCDYNFLFEKDSSPEMTVNASIPFLYVEFVFDEENI